MKPNWSLKDEIRKRAEKESNYQWLMSLQESRTMPLKKCDIINNNAGWYNLIATTLRELKP